eukprot:jgi/Mesen1/10358/ME000080S09747
MASGRGSSGSWLLVQLAVLLLVQLSPHVKCHKTSPPPPNAGGGFIDPDPFSPAFSWYLSGEDGQPGGSDGPGALAPPPSGTPGGHRVDARNSAAQPRWQTAVRSPPPPRPHIPKKRPPPPSKTPPTPKPVARRPPPPPGKGAGGGGGGVSEPKKDAQWLLMHHIYSRKAAQTKSVDLLFGWQESFGGRKQSLYKGASQVYLSMLVELKATGLNFGIAGDRVKNLRWRLENGALPPIMQVKVIVLCIGINDILGGYLTPAQTAQQVASLVSWLRATRPKTGVLVLGLVPESFPAATNEPKSVAERTNVRLASLQNKDNGLVVFQNCRLDFLGTSNKMNLANYIDARDMQKFGGGRRSSPEPNPRGDEGRGRGGEVEPASCWVGLPA